jgi:hypothetical protein
MKQFDKNKVNAIDKVKKDQQRAEKELQQAMMLANKAQGKVSTQTPLIQTQSVLGSQTNPVKFSLGGLNKKPKIN